MEPYRFTDYAGDTLMITESDEPEHPGAMVDTAVLGVGASFCVAPHKLAAVVTAMYQAAGQPVPELPVIVDEAQVKELARLIHLGGCAREHDASRDEAIARYLLAHDVTLPEVSR